MNKFEKYSLEQLKHWLWGWNNIPSLRILFNEDDYEKVLDLLNKERNNIR